MVTQLGFVAPCLRAVTSVSGSTLKRKEGREEEGGGGMRLERRTASENWVYGQIQGLPESLFWDMLTGEDPGAPNTETTVNPQGRTKEGLWSFLQSPRNIFAPQFPRSLFQLTGQQEKNPGQLEWIKEPNCPTKPKSLSLLHSCLFPNDPCTSWDWITPVSLDPSLSSTSVGSDSRFSRRRSRAWSPHPSIQAPLRVSEVKERGLSGFTASAWDSGQN